MPDVVPGKNAMRGFVSFRVGREALQINQTLIVMLGDAQQHIVNRSLRFLILDWIDGNSDVIRMKRNREMIGLLNVDRVFDRLLRLVERNAQVAQRSEIFLHCVFHLRGRHIECLDHRLIHRQLLIDHQVEESPCLGHLVLVNQIVDDHPGLRVIERVMRALARTRLVVFHGEQVLHRQPYRRTHQLRQRLRDVRVAPHKIEDVFVPL